LFYFTAYFILRRRSLNDDAFKEELGFFFNKGDTRFKWMQIMKKRAFNAAMNTYTANKL
jgi:hypothetical protein